MTTMITDYASSSTTNATTTITNTDTDLFQTLVQSPVYLSEDHVRQNVIPTIVTTIIVVSCVYCAAFPVVVNRLIPSTSTKAAATTKDKANAPPSKERRRFAYQTTNLVTNLMLGLLGVYYQYCFLPEEATTQQRITGMTELYILGAIQIGYQIWSIIVGVLYVDEAPEMLIHHVAVICAASTSVFLTNGFRYYAPLALGMTELSSVPLSVMNSFKNNDSWREAFPYSYQASRAIFSLSFLIIRIGIFVPQHVEYLRYTFLINYHSEMEHVGALYKGYMSVAWVGAAFLLFLQLYWATLILKGMSKFFLTQFQVNSKVKTI